MQAILIFIARMLLRAAMDKGLREAVFNAVQTAEQTGLKGEDKMQLALNQIKAQGGKALLKETTSTLRTKVEQVLDDLRL